MRRLVALGLMLIVVGTLAAAPARPLYEPPAVPKPPDPLSELLGSRWEGHFFGGQCQVTFEAAGKLTYHQGDQRTPGTWKMTSATDVYIEINQYSEHRGPVTGNVIRGTSTNRGGLRGEFHLTRMIPGVTK